MVKDIKLGHRGRIKEYAERVPGSTYTEGFRGIWTIPCDIALPCATQNEIDEEIAKTIVAPPGTSEHQLGLAADITDKYYEFKDESLENTELFQWMSANCAQYGFIVRYPKDKEDVTGIMYEPWHFRYVGVEAAEYIMENGLCLEEFVALYEE